MQQAPGPAVATFWAATIKIWDKPIAALVANKALALNAPLRSAVDVWLDDVRAEVCLAGRVGAQTPTGEWRCVPDFFADVMTRAHGDDYVATRPYGSLGDKGCDGYLASVGEVFACYGKVDERRAERVDHRR